MSYGKVCLREGGLNVLLNEARAMEKRGQFPSSMQARETTADVIELLAEY